MCIKTIIPLFIFTIVQGYKYRKSFKNFLIDSNPYDYCKPIFNINRNSQQLNNITSKFKDFTIDQITLLNLEELKNDFIALILDFDGVLSYYGDSQPLPAVVAWLEQAVKVFGVNRIFILSNNPSKIRKEFFNKNFYNQIIFIKGNKPKPYTDGIAVAFSMLQLTSELQLGIEGIDKSKILMVDDRLLSGVLAAKIFGITGCLITKPYINIKKHCILEVWFILVRKIERLLLCRL